MAISLCYFVDNRSSDNCAVTSKESPVGVCSETNMRNYKKFSQTARRRWWSVFKIIFFIVSILLLLASLAVIIRTLQVPSRSQDKSCPLSKSISNPNSAKVEQTTGTYADFHQAITPTSVPNIIERFQRALTFRTITKAPKIYSANETRRFIAFLKKSNLLKIIL